MKKLLFVLCLGLFVGCNLYGQIRVHSDSLNWNSDERVYYEGKLFSGIVFKEYENGQLEYEGNYKDGKEDGLGKRWYESGQLMFEMNYKDGKRDGIIKHWLENGKLGGEQVFKNGLSSISGAFSQIGVRIGPG